MITAEKRCGKAVYAEGLPYSRKLWEANKKSVIFVQITVLQDL